MKPNLKKSQTMNNHFNTPIITEDLFKLHSPVTANVDIEDFLPYIHIAQTLYLEDILGEPLLSELQQQVKENTLTDQNSALIVKIAPVLSFYAVYQGLPFHWAGIVNKGLTIRDSENSRGVNMNDLAQMRVWIKLDAEKFERFLIAFLCKCRSSYPLWRPIEGFKCCDDIIHEGSTNKRYDSGFYFPKSNGCGCQN